MEAFMNWKDVIAEVLVPSDKMSSVIDTYLALGEILEHRQKVADGKYFERKDFDKAILHSMFTLGFLPFWNAHGAGLRPLFIQAMLSEDKHSIQNFFIDAIPYALTIAMPLRQSEYGEIREMVRGKFTKG
jgi:hypothetical protein